MADNGYSNDITFDTTIFKNLDKSFKSRVKLGNGDYINVRGKTIISNKTSLGTKFIHDILYVLEINQNLFSVTQKLEKHYALFFKNMSCIIYDSFGYELMFAKMKNIIFIVEWKHPPAQNVVAFKES